MNGPTLAAMWATAMVNSRRRQRDLRRSGLHLVAVVDGDEDGTMPSITINPAVQFGRPCIEGTRIPASCLAECVAAGDSVDSVASGYEVDRVEVLLACWYVTVYPETKREVKQAERWYPWVTDEAFPALAGWSGKVSDIPDPPRLDGA